MLHVPIIYSRKPITYAQQHLLTQDMKEWHRGLLRTWPPTPTTLPRVRCSRMGCTCATLEVTPHRHILIVSLSVPISHVCDIAHTASSIITSKGTKYIICASQSRPLVCSIYVYMRRSYQSLRSDRVKCGIILHIEQYALCMCSKIDIIMLHTYSNCYTYVYNISCFLLQH